MRFDPSIVTVKQSSIVSQIVSSPVEDGTAQPKMATAQVVETSVTVNNNSLIQDYVHPDDQTQPTFEMNPGFKPFTKCLQLGKKKVSIIVCFCSSRIK